MLSTIEIIPLLRYYRMSEHSKYKLPVFFQYGMFSFTQPIYYIVRLMI